MANHSIRYRRKAHQRLHHFQATILAGICMMLCLAGAGLVYQAQQPVFATIANPGGGNSGLGGGSGEQDQCGNSNTCTLVCNDGTVMDYNKKNDSKTADQECSKHNGAELLVSSDVSCKSDSNCDANHCTNNNCTVTCHNQKSEDISVNNKGDGYDHDPTNFCKGKGGVAVIINKDGSSDAGGGPNAGNNNGSTGPCATKNPPSYCVDPAINCDVNSGGKCDLIAKYLNPAIKVLSIVFGLFVVISLILGGINYTTSEGDPQKVSKAKRRIANTIIALVAYLFLYAFLQFIVPGGIFR